MVSITPKKRLSFGSPELDAMLGGGLIEGSTSLISGAAGVGKTTFGLQFLIAGVNAGQPGLLVSFEEFPASLIRDARELGWDLPALEKAGQLKIIFTSPEVLLNSLKAESSFLNDTIRFLGPERVVIDSAAHFQRLTADPLELRQTYNTLVNALKRENMTSLLLDEAVNVLQAQRGSRMAALPFLVDTVILLRYVEVDSSMQRAVAVLKMRGSAHQKEIRSFQITRGGLKIGEPFTGREGILSGTPYRSA